MQVVRRRVSFLRHLGLLRVVLGAEGDVVHRAAAHVAGQEALGLADVDDAADRIARLVADIAVFAADLA